MLSPRFTKSILLLLASGASGCAAWHPTAEPVPNTILLVSLEDGTLIRQEIQVDAEICLKANDDSATTCLTRAEPIMDVDGRHIIGYHMRRTEIDLYAGE